MQRSVAHKPGMISNPSKTGQGALKPKGGEITPQGRKHLNAVERGIIVDVYPDTYTALVSLWDGRFIANILSSQPVAPDAPTGSVSLPFRGSGVLVTRCDGEVHILGYTSPVDPLVLDDNVDGRRVDIFPDTTGAKDGRYKDRGFARRSGYKPKGMLPGDMGFSGRLGNIVAALDGGINLLRSSEQAQVATFLREQLVKVVGRVYKLYTDFGLVEHKSDSTGTSLVFRGGSTVSSETGTEGWTIRGDLGATGDLVNLRTTEKSGFELAKLAVNKLGDVTHLAKSVTSRVVDNVTQKIQGNHTLTVDKAQTVKVLGDRVDTVEGSLTHSANSRLLNVANNASDIVLGDDLKVVGGSHNLMATSGYRIDLPQGGYTLDVGYDTTDTAKITLKTKKGAFTVDVEQSGDISLSTAVGNVSLATSAGTIALDSGNTVDSVILGSSTGSLHLVKWENLKALLTVLATSLDTHTHSSGGSGPPTTTTQPIISGAVEALKCQVVKVSS